MRLCIERKTIVGLVSGSIVLIVINVLSQENIFSLKETGFSILLFYLIFQAVSREIEERIKIQKNNEKLLSSHQELCQALQKEKELNLIKSRIVATLSHEYRTPLTTILSSAQLLQHYSHKWSEEKKKCHLDRIQKTVQYMTNLIDDVLFIGQAEANRLKFNPCTVDLKQICQEVVEQMNCEVASRIIITWDNQSRYDKVFLDEKLTGQILTNLLSNAIKYSSCDSIVWLKVECVRKVVRFQIEDSGIGIPEADLSKIFEFFYRASNVSALPGTGIGLAVVKKCVDLHGGEIAVESILNQGTKFIVTLPCRLRREDECKHSAMLLCGTRR